MRISNRGASAALAVAAGALALASPAAAKTFHVHPGHKIQTAINAAHSGDTIEVESGTYFQSIQIRKSGITLSGEHVTLRPPAVAPKTACNAPGSTDGICIAGDVTPNPSGPPTINSTIKNVRVSGFTVTHFSGNGMFILGVNGTVVRHDHFLSNGGYGVFNLTSTHPHFLENTSRDNGDAGFYIGDTPHAHATVWRNVSTGNAASGIFLRHASHGDVTHNLVRHNCAGILVLADAPGPAGFWEISRNVVNSNNKGCPGHPADNEAPLSGLGIGLSGANHTSVVGNHVEGNRDLHPSSASGGILVLKGLGGTAPVSDLVKDNVLSHNSPFDIKWDLSGTNIRIKRNDCQKSSPSGLCS